MLGCTSCSYTRRAFSRSGMFEGARSSAALKEASSSTPQASRASCSARAAYFRIWTVSSPDTSAKNQPQLVYMSMVCRCISKSCSALTRSSGPGSRIACRARNAGALRRSGSRSTSMNSSRARQGSRSSFPASRSYTAASWSRSPSSASRRGARHCCFQPGWKQQWRAPLRDALDGLRDQLAAVYEREAGKLLRDPWRARDEFIEVLLDPERRNAPAFLARHAIREPGPEERVKALQLLEMQRQTMLM